MTRFYADEQFPRLVVELLRNLGHDIRKRKEDNGRTTYPQRTTPRR